MEVRGLAGGAAATANWLSNALVSQTFLSLARRLSPAGAFWTYCALAAAGAGWAVVHVPETQGLSLDEIQGLFLERAARMRQRDSGL